MGVTLILDIRPEKTVDRDAEQAEFGKMLLFEDERRLVVIGDREGTGKSQLLKKLKFNCDYRLQVPASLVLLESNPDTSKGRTVTTAIDFVDWLRADLAKHLSFPRYDRLNAARVNYITAAFAQPLDIVQGLPQVAQVQMNVGSVEGGDITGMRIGTLNLPQPPRTWASSEQERLAIQKTIEAFLLDLRQAAARDPVVLLIDSYGEAQPGLDDWIVGEFIQPLLLAQEGSPRAERLLVVLAGHEDKLPAFQEMLALGRLVASLELLGWTKDHFRELLKAHNLHVSDDNFKIVYGKVQKGVSIKGALKLAELLMTLEGSES